MNIMHPHDFRISLGLALMLAAQGAGFAAPRVLLRHSFDGSAGKPDYAAGTAHVTAGQGLKVRHPAIRGKAAWFAEAEPEASLRIELPALAKVEGWTVALWQLLEVKEWLTAPVENLLTLLDVEGKPIIKLSKSGGVFVYENGREVYLDCFDALYWVQGNREHLALTWEAGGNGMPSPGGILRAYWKARPYAALALELKRQPVALEIGQPMAGLAVDELYVFEEALSLRSLWELMRFKGNDIAALEKRLGEREAIEANRPTEKRRVAWTALAKRGQLVEAEARGGAVIRAPAEKPEKNGRYAAGNNAASTASEREAVTPGDEALVFKMNIAETGEYTLALRYILERQMLRFWPQGSEAKTAWTENFSEVEMKLDGKAVGVEKLYPTGSCSGHRGDVEPWAWHALRDGRSMRLAKGTHTLSVRFKKGVARPTYDALLVLGDPVVPKCEHPRWVDQYRIPPAWWVAKHETESGGKQRVDTYTVTLRNRCDEPCSYEILVDNARIQPQALSVNVKRIALKPFEEKSIRVSFRTPVALRNVSGWANIYLWNEDVSLRQKYRLWNLISSGHVKHPVLSPTPDAKLRATFREWLKGRDSKPLTPQLREWARGRNVALSEGSQPVRGFPRALDGDRLAALDLWMKMSEAEVEQYLPDGPSEHNGYGTGWERIGIEYSGLWHKQPKVKSIGPPGDIDMVTSLTVEGPPQKGKTEIYRKTYTRDKDPDMISSARDTRWKSMMGHGISGAAPYGNTLLGRTGHTGITLLAEAYYLTGDKKYARKAYQMLHVFARKYTRLTKHFNFLLNREDRDWWGGRIGGRYLMKFGPRYYHAMGIYVLDLLWDGLTPAERTIIEHNIVRWGMYEGMSGPLFEEPSYFAAVNKEDMPYLPMGRVLGDPAPKRSLQFFYDIYKGIVLDDGIHQCSIGSYGGVSGYINFMEKLHGHGLDVSGNVALRNSFLAHPSFIFAGGGFPNIDDGGGVNINGLGAGFACPSPQQYAWAKKLFKDPRYDQWPAMIAAAKRVNNSPLETKAARMRKEYLDGDLLLEKLWPNLYIAPIKGMAILRNRTATEPIDWSEVIFDYGLYGGRSHGHPAKLATIPSFNGQIVSMEYGYGKLGELMGLFTSSYAHNVVVADGRGQFSTGGAVPVGSLRGSFSDAQVQWADAESTRIYKGIEMRRTVFTTDFGIVDLHLCQSKTSHQYDWMFHSFGEAHPKGLLLKPVKQLAESGPLKFARHPRTKTTGDLVQILWTNAPRTKPPKKQSTALLHEKAYVRVWALPDKDTAVTLFGIPMVEAVGSEIDYLMLRRKAKSTVFVTVQEPWRESTQSPIASIQRLTVTANQKPIADHKACALQVTMRSGVRRVFFINYTPTPKVIGKVTTNADVATWEIAGNGTIQNPKHTKDRSFLSR